MIERRHPLFADSGRASSENPEWLQEFREILVNDKRSSSHEASLEPIFKRREDLTIPWNLAKLVMIFPGIIVRRHHTDHKQMGLLRVQCAE